ncbi:MAG: hypothetical protein H6Q89_5166 [Myxococcaceae bacterium]|nr:hypothetical protein [Myxococcaceae bacterium]
MRLGLLVCLCLACPLAAHAHAGLNADVARLTEQLELAPTASLWLRRASKLRQLERFADALSDVERARAAGASAADWRLERGLIHAAEGNRPAALEQLDAYLGAGGASILALDARAAVLEDSGRFAEAALDLRRAVEQAPDPDRCLRLAQVEQRGGRIEDAARTLERGIARLGGAVVLRHALITLERGRRGHDAAFAQARQAMEGLPVKAEWRLIAAEILGEARRPAQQRAELELAVAELDALLERRSSTLHLQLKERAQLALKSTTPRGK